MLSKFIILKGLLFLIYSNLKLLDNVLKVILKKYFELISNYTFNIFNNHSVNFKNLGFHRFTISPESNKEYIIRFNKF